jgi:RecA-family ATPase
MQEFINNKEEKDIFISVEEILHNKSDIPMLLDPILPKVGLACLCGIPETGKSNFLRQLSMSLVSGNTNFLGMSLTPTHYRAIYVSTQDDKDTIAWALRKQNKVIKGKNEDFSNLEFCFETENLILILNRKLTQTPVDLVCIDTLDDIESSMDTFLNMYSQLAQVHNCLILFTHYLDEEVKKQIETIIELKNDNKDSKIKYLRIVKGVKKKEQRLLFRQETMTFEETENI